MSCYHPLTAFKSKHDLTVSGKSVIRFSLPAGAFPYDYEEIKLPCGQCIGCRLDRSRSWAVRGIHEAKYHDKNCFLTLTYNEDAMLSGCRCSGNLKFFKKDYVDFMKRFRKAIYPLKVRYFHCGEYGDKWQRPHHHSIIFGFDPDDKIPVSKSDLGFILYVDLTDATAATINSLRTAFQVQRLLETDARSGTRYTELLRAHFNTVSPDARLQRPEYLGGSSSPFIVNPVAQTGSTDNTTPQGNLAAFGVAAPNFHGFTKSFVEHGIIIGFVSIRGDLNYQQGVNRMLFRRTRYDYYWPTLAHLGEQAVLNREIFVQGTSDDEDAFGYQERYAELRYHPNMIAGKFRSDYAQSLDVWHLAQNFESLPTLSDDFIRENPPIDRVVAVPSEPHFLLDVYFKLNCVRPMPLYGVPGLVDHF